MRELDRYLTDTGLQLTTIHWCRSLRSKNYLRIKRLHSQGMSLRAICRELEAIGWASLEPPDDKRH